MAEIDWGAFRDLRRDRPGLVAGIARRGVVEEWRSYGASTPGGPALMPRSPFYVGSIAKQFTAATIASLVLEGRLSTADGVRSWFPELSERWSSVRVVHLLAHTSGLPDSNAMDDAAGFGPACRFSTDDRFRVVASTEPAVEPGTVHRYSNHGYVLLAKLVERVTGARFGKVASERLLEPAGMTASGFLDVADVAPVPGWTAGAHRVDIQFRCVGDGGLVTTMEDLAAWDGWFPTSSLAPVMLRDRPVLPNGWVAHDTWGISIRSHHGLRIESHGGSIDGYLAVFVRFPSVGTSVIILANTDQFGIDDLARRSQQLVASVLPDVLDTALPDWTSTHGQPIVSPNAEASPTTPA